MENIKHSSASSEHFTPHEVVRRTRALLGGIDLDPASCAAANSVIDAKAFFSVADNGLAQRWYGNVYLNPPGGKDEKNRSNQKLWWSKLCDEWMSGRVETAIFCGFNLEFLQTCQTDAVEGMPLPFDFPFLVPRHRLEFLRHVDGQFVVGASPTHGNVIVFLPRNMDWGEFAAFERSFGDLGRIAMPRWRAIPLRPRRASLASSSTDLVKACLSESMAALPRPEAEPSAPEE